MNSAKRLHATLIGLMAAGFVLALTVLWLNDAQSLGQARQLSESLSQTKAENMEALVAEKALQTLAPQAVLIDGRRGEILEALRKAADSAPIAAWSGAAPAAPAAAPAAALKKRKAAPAPAGADPQAALTQAAQDMASVWESAQLVDKTGKVMATFPAPAPGAPAETDLSKDSFFKDLSNPAFGTGIVRHSYVKVVPLKTPTPAPDPKAKTSAPAKPAPRFESKLVAGVGIADADGNFAGLIKIRVDVRQSLLGGDASPFDAFIAATPRSKVLLVRGNGEEIYNSAKDPLTENLGAVNPEYKALLASAMASPTGRQKVAGYDGEPGVVIWQRVGSVPDGAAPEDVVSLLAFVPSSSFGAAGAEPSVPKPFYTRPLVLLLLLLALGLPLAAGWFLLPGVLDPFALAAREARRIEEFSPIPELSLPEFADADAQAINRALTVLAKRGIQSEERVKELDAALRRAEEDNSRENSQAARELSELREKLSSVQASQQASDLKFEAAQKARQDAEAQLSNLRSALETSTRNTELKSAENRNLGSQLQDLMRALEEQRKVSEKAQEGFSRKENEAVRLAAVNTLSSELKATLTVIKNYISTMLGSQGAISDAQQEFLGVVINKSARLERLIGDLVEISEIGSGVKPLRLEAVTPSSLVQEALVNARPQAEHKKISLELAESGNLSLVQVDREKMGAVLRTLLSQAVKVTSRNEKIGLLLSERESTVELRVTDPGMSLPPDRAAKVFIQFHGVDSQAGPEFIGTGLRFPILKSVVEAHGGKIWIESQVGRGKTFVLVLPKAGASVPAADGPAPALEAAAKPAPASGPAILPPPPPVKPASPAFAPLPPPALAAAPLPPPPPAPAAKVGLPPLGPPPAAPPALSSPPAAPAPPALPGGPPVLAGLAALVPKPVEAPKTGLDALGPLPAAPSESKASKPLPPPGTPGLVPVAPPAPAGPPALPTPPPMKDPAPAPAKPVSGPAVHKPAPVDESLNAPWKRKESDPNDAMEELMDLPDLASVKPSAPAVVPSLPPPPAVLPATAAVPPLAPPAPLVLKTDAKPNAEDKADFDRVFGETPSQASGGAAPKVELKTNAKPNDQDLAQFSALFGPAPSGTPAPAGAPKPAPSAPAPRPVGPPPPGMGAPPPPPQNADFEKLFGGAPASPKPAAPKPAGPPPPGLGTPPPPQATDFEKVFGGPSPAAAAAPKPAAPGAPASADFDKIFGETAPAAPKAPPAPPKAPAAPPAAAKATAPAPPAKPLNAPKPVVSSSADFDALFGPPAAPAPPAAKPADKPAAPPSGGLNTMDDLNQMLGK